MGMIGRMPNDRICFGEDEAFLVIWVLSEYLADALAGDAWAEVALIEAAHNLVRQRIDEQRPRD